MSNLPLIGLVMVVKDEAERIERALESVKPLIGWWTICDTGSTDDTKKLIRSTLSNIPGRLYDHRWRDFGHNRTLALARAHGTARWLLMLDADEEVVFNPEFAAWLAKRRDRKTAAYQVMIYDHGTSYWNPYLTRGDLDWRYVGPTHEFLDPAGRRQRVVTGLTVVHHGKEGDQREKLLRDIELLRPGFQRQEPRAVFYTAESHRYLGNDEQAALIYDLRASLNGWEEERWYSRYQAAACRSDLEELLEVWRERPWRHEPLTAAARIVAAQGGQGDILFLERPPV